LYYFVGKFVDHFPARVSFSQPGIKPEPRGSSPEPANDKKTIRNDKKMIKTRGFLHFLYFCSMFQSGSRFIIFFIICLSFFYCFLSFPNLCIIFLKIVDHFPARVSFSQPGSKPEPRGSSPEPANDEKTIKT